MSKYQLGCFNPGDRKLIERFIREAEVHNVSYPTIHWYIGKLRSLKRKFLKKNFDRCTKRDIEDVCQRINQHGYSLWTVFAFKISIKKLFQITKGYSWHSKKYPSMVEWIRTSTNQLRYKKKYDILDEKDVQKLIDSCSSKRDQAFIGILFSSGTRISEIAQLKQDDCTWDENGLIISVSGKTGSRRIRVCEYANLLREYLEQRNNKTNVDLVIDWLQSEKSQKEIAEEHSMSQGRLSQIINKMYSLFCKEFKLKIEGLHRKGLLRQKFLEWLKKNHPVNPGDEYVWLTEWPRGRRMKKTGLRKVLDRAKSRSGISKPCNPHALRHAKATQLSKFMTDAQMRKFFGWQFNSPMSSLYSHLSCRDIDSKIIEISKLREKPEPRLSERVNELERIIDKISIVQTHQNIGIKKMVEDEILAM